MNNIKKIFFLLDNLYLNSRNKFIDGKKGIIFLLFHSVFKNRNEINYKHINPMWGFTLNEYNYIFEKFLNNNYIFISHQDLMNHEKLKDNEKYVYLHFDDGYYNNHNILHLLEEYKIPAHFFVVTNNIIKNKKFWWDFMFNKSYNSRRNIKYLHSRDYDFIENYIFKKYGKDSLNPLSDIDRPFTPKELKLFSLNNYVTIGNHTCDHSLLVNLDSKKIYNKIITAENHLKKILGYDTRIFSFPGNQSKKIHFEILKSLNFNYAFSNEFKINKKENIFDKNKKYNLGRFCFVSNKDIDWQIKMCMSGFSPYLFFSKLYNLLN